MKIINQSIANRGRGVVSGNILRMVTVVSDVIVLQLSVILYIWKLVTQVVCDKEQIYYVCCSRLGLSNTAHTVICKGRVFYSHVEQTYMTTSFHWERVEVWAYKTSLTPPPVISAFTKLVRERPFNLRGGVMFIFF